MSRSPYGWEPGCLPPIVQQHSVAKHDILRAYLGAYIRTLVADPKRDEFRLVLVDGFAGGGIYRHAHTGKEVLGSPFIMLDAVKEADAAINAERRKQVKLNIEYFFIEKESGAASYLRETLAQMAQASRIGHDIHLINSTFESSADRVIEHVRQKMPRRPRAIFLLDQYGYSDVPAALIAKILNSLPGSEVILTFNVDALLNFFSEDSDKSKGLLQRIGIPDALKGRSFDDIKRSDADWRLMIQACLYRELVDQCAAQYYTLFFIRSDRGHGDYWLIHFSQNPRARDVMTQIHWQHNNHFIHYGGAGLDMFRVIGYVSKNDAKLAGHQPSLFRFDDDAKKASTDLLVSQIAPMIYANDVGMTFAELFATTCNLSPASADIYRSAVNALRALREVEVISATTGKSTQARIQDGDRLVVPSQRNLILSI